MHDLPDFVYFDHSIHVNKGVGCTTCHGQVDRMPLMWQEASLQMEWCLDCHRNPERYVRPRDAVFRVDYQRRRANPASDSSARQAGRRIPDSEAHELLDVPPMKTAKPSPVLAHARRARGRSRRFSERLSQRVPVRRSKRSRDPVDAPDVPEADGRIAGARRRHRLHDASRTRRSSRTSGSPRSWSPAGRCSSRRR